MQVGQFNTESVIDRQGSTVTYLARRIESGTTNIAPKRSWGVRDLYYVTVYTPASEEDAHRFTERIRILRTMQEPRIERPTLGGSLHDGSVYVASPFRQQLVIGEGTLPLQTVQDVMGNAADTLAQAHNAGLVHGALRRHHLLPLPMNRIAIRGYELLAEATDRAADISALAAIGASLIPNRPEAVTQVFNKGIRGDYNNVNDFYVDLVQSIRNSRSDAVRNRRRNRILATLAGIAAVILIGLVITFLILQLATGESPLLSRSFDQTATSVLATNTAVARALEQTTTANAELEIIADAMPQPSATPTEFMSSTNTLTAVTNSATPNVTETATATVTTTSTSSATATTPAPTATIPSATPTIAATNTTEPTVQPTIVLALPTTAATNTIQPTPLLSLPTIDTSSVQSVAPTTTPYIFIMPSATPQPSQPATSTPLFPTESVETGNQPTPVVNIAAQTNACISMVGDSVTHGTGVYEVPGIGYVFVQAQPVAVAMQKRIQELGLTDYKVYDRGAPNTGISSYNHGSYWVTNAYARLLEDHCRYTVIMPWVNDITPEVSAPEGAIRHARMVIELARTLRSINPYGQILILKYYTPDRAPFAANTWASGFNNQGILLYNNEIEKACRYGTLSTFTQVTCSELQPAFTGIEGSHVIKYTDRATLYNLMITALSADEENFINYYFSSNPGGMILGDGVHLSPLGKTALAIYVCNLLQTLPPLQSIDVVSAGIPPVG